jgi:hypothetical protein
MSRRRRRIGFLEVLGYLFGGAFLLPAIWAVGGHSSQGPLSLVVGLAACGLIITLECLHVHWRSPHSAGRSQAGGRRGRVPLRPLV